MSATGASADGRSQGRASRSRNGSRAWSLAAACLVALGAPLAAGNVEIGGAQVKTYEWLSYGPEVYMVADVHLVSAGPQPCIVYLHGGGSVSGPVAMKFSSDEAPFSQLLAEGFPIVSAHYGSSVLGAAYPDQNVAVRQLLRWVNEVLIPSSPANFDGKVVLWGVSHGGLLALREAFGPQLKNKHRPDLVAAWAAPTHLPYFDQGTPTQLATHFTGQVGSSLSEVPFALQKELSPAAVFYSHGNKKVPAFAAYWTSPSGVPAGSLIDPHDGMSGALLAMAYPGVDLSFYEDVIGELPETLEELDPSFPMNAMIEWIRGELEETP